MALRISAIRGSNRQIVIVINVARSTSDVRVAGCEQESSRAVIERCGHPTHGGVARRAIRNRKCGAR
jgi:hypothetical protein